MNIKSHRNYKLLIIKDVESKKEKKLGLIQIRINLFYGSFMIESIYVYLILVFINNIIN